MASEEQAGSGSTPGLEPAVNAPRPFALGRAPEPAEFPDPPDNPKKTGAATHTGTDPHGRAIGPAEDHTKAKRDIDGNTAARAAGEDQA